MKEEMRQNESGEGKRGESGRRDDEERDKKSKRGGERKGWTDDAKGGETEANRHKQ